MTHGRHAALPLASERSPGRARRGLVRLGHSLVLFVGLSISTVVAACNGCKGSGGVTPPVASAEAGGRRPSLRIYVLSTVAGALEPCGCSAKQLGGLDRLASFVEAERARAPSVTVAVGPLFFMDPEPRAGQETQDEWKADALADGLARLGLVAFTPGQNDFGAGDPKLAALRERTHGALVLSNAPADAAGATRWVVREVGGYKVGFVGAFVPKSAAGRGGGATDVAAAIEAAIAQARGEGARVIVGLFAMQRGEALRLVERVPGIDVAAIGKPESRGDLNDRPTETIAVGETLVVETANHLQNVAAVDVFLAAKKGPLSPVVDGPVPAEGGATRASLRAVSDDLTKNPAMGEILVGYYTRVNEHNKAAFAGKAPPPVGPNDTAYVGGAACAACHGAAMEVWKKTPHARAYDTLVRQAKEYNLECVSCHVTGYERPGGSTVTQNDKLRDVQCEACHGPGAKHAKSPSERGAIVASPPPDGCVSACHHPPHVDDFDPRAKLPLILGPGHGLR